MVFKRYSSPFIFLDNLLENDNLSEGIDFLYEQVEEEKWWNLYLATLPLNDKSYQDWKKDMQGGTSISRTENTTKIDVDTVIQNSQNILSGFKPPQ